MTSSDLVPDLPVDLVPIMVGRFERSAFVLVNGLSTSSQRRPGDRDEVAPEGRPATRDLRVSARPEVTDKSRRPTSSRDCSSDRQAHAKPAGHSFADLVPIMVATSSRPDDPSRDEVTHHLTSQNVCRPTSSHLVRDDLGTTSATSSRPSSPYRDEDERREPNRHTHPRSHPMSASARTHTPDRKNPDGTTTIKMKRACNGCGLRLGDVTDEEMTRGINGLPLPDVRRECPACGPTAPEPRCLPANTVWGDEPCVEQTCDHHPTDGDYCEAVTEQVICATHSQMSDQGAITHAEPWPCQRTA